MEWTSKPLWKGPHHGHTFHRGGGRPRARPRQVSRVRLLPLGTLDTALSISSPLCRLLFKVGREEEFQLRERMVPALLQELEGKTLEQVGGHGDCSLLLLPVVASLTSDPKTT